MRFAHQKTCRRYGKIANSIMLCQGLNSLLEKSFVFSLFKKQRSLNFMINFSNASKILASQRASYYFCNKLKSFKLIQNFLQMVRFPPNVPVYTHLL